MTRNMLRHILSLFLLLLIMAIFIPPDFAQSQIQSGREPAWIPNTDLIAISDGYTMNIYNSNLTLVDKFELFNESEVEVNGFQRAWSPDGEKVAINADVTNRATHIMTEILQIWERTSPTKLAEITGILGGSPLAWNSASDRVAAIAYTGVAYFDEVHIYRASDGTLLNTLLYIDKPHVIQQMVWKPGSSQLAVLLDGVADELHIWDINTNQSVLLITDHVYPDSAIAFDSTGSQIAFVEDNSPNQIQVWNINPLTSSFTIAAYTDYVWDFSWSGDKIVSVGLGEDTKVWNAGTGTLLYTLPAPMTTAPFWKSDGTKYIGEAETASNPGIYDAATGTLLAEMCDSCVQSFSLINADTNTPIRLLTNGETLSLANLPARNLNIRVEVSGRVSRVDFSIIPRSSSSDTTFPFTVSDDMWTPVPGTYTLTATPYKYDEITGTPLTISFTVTS